MKTKELKKGFSKTLKLPPALGDWTKLNWTQDNEDILYVSKIDSASFDSLSKAELEKLHTLHYLLAEKIIADLSACMDMKIELYSVSAEQLSYEQFCQNQRGKRVQVDYFIKNKGHIDLTLDWKLAAQMVNRLTGGKGLEEDKGAFSELECTILETQLESLMGLLQESWKTVFSMEEISLAFNCGEFRPNKKIASRDGHLSFEFVLSFGNRDIKSIRLGYPNSLVRNFLKEINKMPKSSEQTVSLKKNTLKKSFVEVSASLGSAQLTMSELRNLQQGDVIPLEAELNSPLELKISNDIVFLAQPGINNDRLSLQILKQNSKEVTAPSLVKIPEPLPASEDHQLSTQLVEDYGFEEEDTNVKDDPFQPLSETSKFEEEDHEDAENELELDASEAETHAEHTEDIEEDDESSEWDDEELEFGESESERLSQPTPVANTGSADSADEDDIEFNEDEFDWDEIDEKLDS